MPGVSVCTVKRGVVVRAPPVTLHQALVEIEHHYFRVALHRG